MSAFKRRGQVIAGKSPQNAFNALKHEGVKPSISTSQPTISTGSEDLDGLLGHWGLPLGNMLMIEETGTTDFASILLRSFGAQGIVHNRLENGGGATKIVVIGGDESWGRELPGLYKDKKAAKLEKAQEDQSKITVGNINEKNRNLKIAWRYTRPNATQHNAIQSPTEQAGPSTKPNFSSTFDFTTRITPPPSKSEVTYLGTNLAAAVTQLEKILQDAGNNIVRVIVPSLLHPAIYEPQTIESVIPFLHCLRNVCRKYQSVCAAMISISLELFPRYTAFTRNMEHTVDGLIHLEPFKVPLLPDSNEKQDQGLIHLYKLPVSSEKGVMVKRLSEHAFRVGRRQFEIKEFGIPVDESEATDYKPNPIDY